LLVLGSSREVGFVFLPFVLSNPYLENDVMERIRWCWICGRKKGKNIEMV
jgi:hypothetical protein